VRVAQTFDLTSLGNFSADPQYFILNLPPRPGGWPGTIYTPDMRFVVERGVTADPRLERGPPFDRLRKFLEFLSVLLN
jgi:hypothetical protein